jgi:hypothetical protein
VWALSPSLTPKVVRSSAVRLLAHRLCTWLKAIDLAQLDFY